MRRSLLTAAIAAVLVAVTAIVIVTTRHPQPAVSGVDRAPARALPAAGPVSPHELLTGDAAEFSTTTGGWSSPNAALSVVATPTHRGAGAMAVSGTHGAGSVSAWSPSQPAQAGRRYVASAWVRAVTAARGVRDRLRFIDANGQVTDTESGQLLSDSTTSWQQVYAVAAIAPKGTARVQFGIQLPVVGAGSRHLLDDATLAETPGPAPDVVGPLHVVGTSIVDEHGRAIILRGLQRFGLEGGTHNPLPTAAEIAQLKGWGANEVRLSLGEQKWLTSSCHFVAGYPKTVDQVVHEVTTRGMVALVNLHYSTLTPCGKPGLTPMADSPGALTFWQEVATRYQDNPLVAFDLFNEPHVPPRVWLDGGSFNAGGTTVQAAGMQQLYDTVRQTGATNLVVVSGLDYAERPPVQTVQGNDIVYGIHAYTCSSSRPPNCADPHPYDAAGPMSHWTAFAATHAVLVTEFGFPDGDDGRYNASAIDYAEAQHWGWSGFAWDGGTDGRFDLLQAHPASDGSTYEPNAAGMPLVAGFAANVVHE